MSRYPKPIKVVFGKKNDCLSLVQPKPINLVLFNLICGHILAMTQTFFFHFFDNSKCLMFIREYINLRFIKFVQNIAFEQY